MRLREILEIWLLLICISFVTHVYVCVHVSVAKKNQLCSQQSFHQMMTLRSGMFWEANVPLLLSQSDPAISYKYHQTLLVFHYIVIMPDQDVTSLSYSNFPAMKS